MKRGQSGHVLQHTATDVLVRLGCLDFFFVVAPKIKISGGSKFIKMM